jgi:hypothetical protein
MNPDIISLLMDHGGPILRWRTATELAPDASRFDPDPLQQELLACPEVRYWLSMLGSGPVHHSKDASAENALAKCCEYGLSAGMAELDERALPFCAVSRGDAYHQEALIIVPFLVRAGYAAEPRLAAWMRQRIDLLYELAGQGNYDLYMDAAERKQLPASQQMLHRQPKLFYKLRFNHHWGYLGLPTCYDLYALAYLPKEDASTRQKIEAIVAYLLHPDFQDTPGGYIWNPQLHRPYAAGRVFLACLPTEDQPEKLVLFMEMLAHVEVAKASAWFRNGLAHLETFKTERGTYCFPPHYLSEKHSYYLYTGMHMGLGEHPRSSQALELESTFRMVQLHQLLNA